MKTRISTGLAFGMALIVAATACAMADGPLPAPAPAPSPATNSAQRNSHAALSAGSLEIQKLAQAGVDERVVLSYITNVAGMFKLTPEQVIHLTQQRVSGNVLAAMLHHDAQLMAGLGSWPGSGAAGGVLATPIQPGESILAAESDLPSILGPPYPPAGGPQIVADVEPSAEAYSDFDDYYAPEQPQDVGPVRVPYAVKLNDPIVILRLPTFSVPCW